MPALREEEAENMKVAHISDVHYCPKYLNEVDRCFVFAVTKAIESRCDAAVLSGDIFDHRLDLHAPAVSRCLDRVVELASKMPVLILQGTFSHDVPGSLDVFKGIPGVHVADRIEQVELVSFDDDRPAWYPHEGNAAGAERWALFSCLPSINKAQVAAAVGGEDAAAKVGDAVADLMKAWAQSHAEARESGVPSIVVSHGTVNGCETEHGVPMAGLDHEFSVGALGASQADAVMLGHIHKHQFWEADSGTFIAYPGSCGRLHFGEKDPKGFLIWKFSTEYTAFDFIETPAKRLVEVAFDGPPDMDELKRAAEGAEGAHVRVRWVIDEEHKADVDREAIEALFGDAEEVKLEGRIQPVQRRRAEGISEALSVSDKLKRWAESTSSEYEPLAMRLAQLEEGKGVEDIVKAETGSAC